MNLYMHVLPKLSYKHTTRKDMNPRRSSELSWRRRAYASCRAESFGQEQRGKSPQYSGLAFIRPSTRPQDCREGGCTRHFERIGPRLDEGNQLEPSPFGSPFERAVEDRRAHDQSFLPMPGRQSRTNFDRKKDGSVGLSSTVSTLDVMCLRFAQMCFSLHLTPAGQ